MTTALKKIKQNTSSKRFPRASSEDLSDGISSRADCDYVQDIISYRELISEMSSIRPSVEESLNSSRLYGRQSSASSARSIGSFREHLIPLPSISEQMSSGPGREVNGSIRIRSPPTSRLSILSNDPDANFSYSSFETPVSSQEEADSITLQERSILSSSDAFTVTQRLRSVGSEDDFLLALNMFKPSRLDEEEFVHLLEEINALGSPSDYSRSLKALKRNGAANFTLTVKYLKGFRDFGNKADYPYTLGVLEGYLYKFPETQEVLESLINITERCDNYSIAVRLLHRQKYNAKSTTAKLQQLKDIVPDMDDYSRVLLFLQHNQFSIKRTLNALDQMLSFTRQMAGDYWRRLTDSTALHHSLVLLEKNDYGVERTTSNLAILQGLGNSWKDFICLLKTLEENRFDMEETVEDMKWLKLIVKDRASLASVLAANNYSPQVMRILFEEIYEMGGKENFFQTMKALERNGFNFRLSLDSLNRLHQLATEPADYSIILKVADRLSWKEDRIHILFGETSQSGARALTLLRQNNARDQIWLDGLSQLANLSERRYEDSLRSLAQLDYNFGVTLRFVEHVKDPMGCGGVYFSTSLSIFNTFDGKALDKEEIARMMNALGLFECSQERLTFIFSSISYNSVRMRKLLSKLLSINDYLNRAQRTAYWLLQNYANFRDFMHIMESLTTRWTTDEDRSIVLDFLETLDGDYRRAERIIGELQQLEKGSSLERVAVPNRALDALRRNDYKSAHTLREWRRMHAVNPRTTHWDSVLKVHERCLCEIEYTIPVLERFNDECSSDPFWYDVFVVHAAEIRTNNTTRKHGVVSSGASDRATLRSNTDAAPTANQVISHFKANYKYDGKTFRSKNMGMGSAHLDSVVRDDKKGLYGRTHITTPL
jgi:hypothetical protein